VQKITWLLRILVFYIVITPITIIFAVMAITFFLLPTKYRFGYFSAWSNIFIFTVKIICGIKHEITGIENIPNTPCVFVSNHQSLWETIFFNATLPPHCWILKQELLWIPFFGWGLAMLEPINLDRKNILSIKKIIQEGKKKIANGHNIIIFPEATRVAPSDSKSYSRTAAALAIATHTPILPIAHNAGVYWPKGFLPKQPGTIRVKIGKMIPVIDQTATQITEQAKEWIERNKKG
jgi:1-acyl-sn-glycerol-3-phosphate acyltransferase